MENPERAGVAGMRCSLQRSVVVAASRGRVQAVNGGERNERFDAVAVGGVFDTAARARVGSCRMMQAFGTIRVADVADVFESASAGAIVRRTFESASAGAIVQSTFGSSLTDCASGTIGERRGRDEF